MPVEIHEFEVSPAPAPAQAQASGGAAPAATPPPEPDLQTLAQSRRIAAAARELLLRTFVH